MTQVSKHSRSSIDWAAIRQRMATAIEQTGALLDPLQSDAHPTSQSGATTPAVAPVAAADPESSTGFVFFPLSFRRYAVDIRYIREIVTKANVSPLPGMPAHVVGVHDLRGQLLPIFDLRDLLGLPAQPVATVDWAIVCGEAQPEFLVLTDGIPEVVELAPDAISMTEADGNDGLWSRGSTAEGVAVLDGAALLSDRRFILEGEQMIDEDENGRGSRP
ncbi:chemotaxis protein CheW [Pararhizobium sp. LjRoot255]|uniref:chemotaxis protein CheW n=1 Tax=Pararhizobium sp. LjRoot255 TaxID=3342298 RepID=UPI003ECD0ADC